MHRFARCSHCTETETVANAICLDLGLGLGLSSVCVRSVDHEKLLNFKFDKTVNYKQNKKVLLRECKKHTARHTTSVCCADLSWQGGGGGYLPWPGGYLPWPGGIYPSWRGTYPGWGYLPWPGGVPHHGVYPSPPSGPGPPPRCEQADTCENITFRCTRYAGGKKSNLFKYFYLEKTYFHI